MRLAVAAAAAALLAACGSKKATPTNQGAPPAPTCDNAVRTPIAFADGAVQDLGTIDVGGAAQFEVPAGTAAFFIVSQAVGTSGDPIITWSGTRLPNVVVPRIVQGPSGTLYDDFVTPPSTTISGLVYLDDYTGTLAEPGFDAAVGIFWFPNTSGALQAVAAAGSVEAGTWNFTVSDWAYECALFSGGACTGGNTAGRYHVHVVTRATPTTPPTLDVEVYLATGSSSPLATASAAAASPQVTRWEQSLAHYLSQGGITLGQVTFNDLSAAVKQQYAPNGDVDVGSTGPCSSLSQLFTSGVVASRAVSIFLADGLIAPTIGGSFKIAGVDGSIPGPSLFPGTVNSGAIVGLEDFGFEQSTGACDLGAPLDIASCGTDRTAYITAHEIGHWLGLYHVTEEDGTFFDPLADTSVCPCHACASSGQQANCADVNPGVSSSSQTLITADRCVTSAGCGGGDNLMFWVVSDTHSTGALSPDQRAVMQLNPAVH